MLNTLHHHASTHQTPPVHAMSALKESPTNHHRPTIARILPKPNIHLQPFKRHFLHQPAIRLVRLAPVTPKGLLQDVTDLAVDKDIDVVDLESRLNLGFEEFAKVRDVDNVLRPADDQHARVVRREMVRWRGEFDGVVGDVGSLAADDEAAVGPVLVKAEAAVAGVAGVLGVESGRAREVEEGDAGGGRGDSSSGLGRVDEKGEDSSGGVADGREDFCGCDVGREVGEPKGAVFGVGDVLGGPVRLVVIALVDLDQTVLVVATALA